MLGNWQPTALRTGAGIAVAALLLSGWAANAMAQGGPRIHRTALTREEEKGFIDDLSRTRDEFGFDRDRHRPRPDTPMTQPTPEMKKIRPLIDEFQKEISLLKSQLSDELSRNQSVRGLLSDAYNVTADATYIAKRARNENDHMLLIDDLQTIDAAWGELSYRLKGVQRLSRESLDYVANLDDIAAEVRQALEIGQQVNYRDLSSKTISLSTGLENLIEDIQYELRRTAEGQKLIAATSKARQQVIRLADLSDDRADLNSITGEYRRFQELWYPQAAKLQSLDRDYFSRSLRRIAQSDGELGRLLLLQDRFDKKQIVYLTSALRKDIDDFFYYATLEKVLRLPRWNAAMATADEFYGVCENFVATVNQNDAKYEDIVDAFRYIEQADRSFIAVFGQIEDDKAASALENISQTLNALRTALQVDREDFNRQTAIALAAKIENLSDSIDYTARRWLAQDRQPFAQQCLDETDLLAQQAADLHQLIVSGANVQRIRQDTEQVYQTWRRVYNHIIQCRTSERAALGRYSSNLTPALVQMRTLVAQ
jgi:hypothetical protein